MTWSGGRAACVQAALPVPRTITGRAGGNEKAFALSNKCGKMANHQGTEGSIRKHCRFNSCGACHAWKNVRELFGGKPGRCTFKAAVSSGKSAEGHPQSPCRDSDSATGAAKSPSPPYGAVSSKRRSPFYPTVRNAILTSEVLDGIRRL